MRAVVGIASGEDIKAVGSFLSAAKGLDEITAVAVVPRPSVLTAIMEEPRRWQRELRRLRELERAGAYELLESLRSELAAAGMSFDTRVQFGDPARELISVAREKNADFILVSRNSRDQVGSSSSLGHVASQVARYAKCSVILLSTAAPAPHSIMYATDGSPQADRAGARLQQLGITGSPVLVLCNVVAPVRPAFVSSGGIAYVEYQRVMHNLRAEQERSARQLLADAGSAFEGTGFRRGTRVYTGDPAQSILKAIEELNTDFLVLGAKGVSATATLLLGSITLKLMTEADCSMLIAR